MSRYGSSPCTECGAVSELLLAPRFPHICARCLFPPYQPDPRELVQALMHRMTSRSSGGSNSRAGLSAHVCDTLYLYEVVATYRSEFRRGPDARDTHAAAIRDAEQHAERLNRDAA